MAITPTKDQVQERITAAITSFGPTTNQVVPEATWGQLGIDSLHLVELAEIASEDYGVQLQGQDFEDLTTVGEAIDLIWSRAQSAHPAN
jgi:acyl carrier protein